MFQKENTMYVFIDASNLWAAQKAKGRFFDYAKLKAFLKSRLAGTSIEVFYYTAYPADGTRDYSLDGRHKFFTFLKKGLGFTVRKKELIGFSGVGNVCKERREESLYFFFRKQYI